MAQRPSFRLLRFPWGQRSSCVPVRSFRSTVGCPKGKRPSINQAPITGESVPVAKRPGDDVFAGTINEDGAIEIVTTKPADDSTLARITRLVSDAQSKRSQSEQWVETFAR